MRSIRGRAAPESRRGRLTVIYLLSAGLMAGCGATTASTPTSTVTVTVSAEVSSPTAAEVSTVAPPEPGPSEVAVDGQVILATAFPNWSVEYVAPPMGETAAVSAWYGHDPDPVLELSGAAGFAFSYASDGDARSPQEESYLATTMGNIAAQFPATPLIQLICSGGTVLIINADAAESQHRLLADDYGCERY